MSKRPRVVIAGAGFGGAYVYKYLHDALHGTHQADLFLVNPTNYLLFTPLLHEVATGSLDTSVVTEPIRQVLGCCLADFQVATVERVDLRNKKLVLSRGDLDYDYLVLALGSRATFYDTPGAEEHSFTLKTLPDAVRLKNHIIDMFELASHEADRKARQRLLRFVVIGGGPTGVELAAEISQWCQGTFARYYSADLVADIEVVLVEAGPRLLAKFPERLGTASQRALKHKGVSVRLGVRVTKVTQHEVRLADDGVLPTLTPIWVAGVVPADVELIGDAEKDATGRVVVQPTLQLAHYPEVFVLGDMARFEQEGGPLPQLAQVASKQAKTAAHNLAALLDHRPPENFVYHHAGTLVSLGRWMAVAQIKGFFFQGRFAWWLWRTVYLAKLLSWRKKIQVAVQWTVDLFSPRDISKID